MTPITVRIEHLIGREGEDDARRDGVMTSSVDQQPTLDELAQRVADANAETQRASDAASEADRLWRAAEQRFEACSSDLRNAVRLLIESKAST